MLDHGDGVTSSTDEESTVLLDRLTSTTEREARKTTTLSIAGVTGVLVACAIAVGAVTMGIGRSSAMSPSKLAAALGAPSVLSERAGTFLHSKSCQWRLDRAAKENARCNPRGTDVVVVDELRAVYVDITKAASESVRERLASAFGASWEDPKYAKEGEYDVGARGKTHVMRSTTASLPDDILDTYTFFTFVRNPSERFASAYRQAFCRSMCQGCEAGKTPTRPPTMEQTIDLMEIMREKSRKDQSFCSLKDGSTNEWNFLNNPWLDEHLQSATFRMSGVTHRGNRVPMHFIGRVESLDEDWRRLMDHLSVDPAHAARAPLKHVDHACDLTEREKQLNAQIEVFRDYIAKRKRAPEQGELYEPVSVVYDGVGQAVQIPKPSTDRGEYFDRFRTLYEDDYRCLGYDKTNS